MTSERFNGAPGAVATGGGTGILPVGKLPGALLGELLGGIRTDDQDILIGPGVGRDAAALAIGGAVLVAKTDPITFASVDAASYLVDINANDVACLGADPRWLLVTALLPEGQTTADDVAAQFRALHAAAARRGVSLIGGHTEITAGLDRPLLVGTMLGTTTRDRLLRPGGARPGNRLLLTKAIAIEGTALLANERGPLLLGRLGAAGLARARDLLSEPGISIAAEASALLAAGGVTALHDPTEGGLATGARELADCAGVGVWIDGSAVPVDPLCAAIADQLGLDPLGMLASGSLLVAAEPSAVPGLVAAGARIGVPVTEIGQVVPSGQGCLLRTARGSEPLPEYATDEVSRSLGNG